MKSNLTMMLLCGAMLTTSATTVAQVTIGSGIAPVSGALLDLKEKNALTPGGSNSTKGMLLPRVELQDPTKLKIGIAAELDGAAREAHAGLWVFNVSETLPFCKGAYVWDSREWQRIGEPCILFGVSPAGPFTFLSGQNGSTITPQSITVTLPSSTAVAGWGNVASALYNQVNFTAGIGVTPLPWTSPQVVTLTPDAMTVTEVSDTGGNPFLAKESELIFTATENGKTLSKSILVKQVNKAILVNGKISPSQLSYTTDTPNATVTVESNAEWKLASITPTINSAITFANVGAANGAEKDDGTANLATTISYAVTVGADRSRYNYLTFADNRSPKRFSDVVLTVTQCSAEKDLTMEQYKNLWEEMYGLDPLNEEHDSDGDITKNVNKVQWHRDQAGNVFFSAMFNGERWMITNLAANTYDLGVATPPALSQNYDNCPSPYTDAYYAYPNVAQSTNAGAITKYVARERLGRLYNWAAATGNHNLSTTDQQSTAHANYQGICPDNWHLPSDLEWTNLINSFVANPTQYSDNAVGANTSATVKDMCEPTINTGKSFGVLDGGFNVLLAGQARNSQAELYGIGGYFWSASSHTDDNAWCRFVEGIGGPVYKTKTERYALFSVRCKKN